MRHPETIGLLNELRERSGPCQVTGLPLEQLDRFLDRDERLAAAIRQAAERHRELRATQADLLRLDEAELCRELQSDYENFYPQEGVMPYVPLAAAGPWIVTSHGAVVHDSGGYGMLGLGHGPGELMTALSRPWVMANVMTPSFSQLRLAELLKQEIGRGREACPFARFICMNSGSEAVTVAARIADINARRLTDPGGPHEGETIRYLSLEESFHGRTARAARLSHSTQALYEQHLASFRDDDRLRVVPPNDIAGLREVFARADDEGVFFEAFFVEPVMGEGSPGMSLDREFYDVAHELTSERGTLLVVDSIQAALRAHGCLSIVDYPGYEGCAPPDMETYSKALNAGQFPLSVLALTEASAELYVRGVYGNTMTTNPRALEVACAVLESLTEELRENIRRRGVELKAALIELAERFPGAITSVSGTGLMLCAELAPERYQVSGEGGFEQYLRRKGVSMIHGGRNGLRLTPHFAITSAEVSLIVETIEQGLVDLGQGRTSKDAARLVA